MPTYTVRFKDEVVTRLESDAPKVRIGRSEECEIHIDNLGISRYHAVVEMKDGVRVIRDLGSHNGVYFNGKPVKTRVLNDGDVFVIGKYRLEFGGEVPGVSESKKVDTAALPSADEMGMKTFAIEPSALAHLQQSERVKGHLKREDGKTFDLRQTVTTVGKDPRCDIAVGGFFAPRVMAVIVRDERGFTLVNTAGSPSKVLANERPVPMQTRLENEHPIRFGRTRYTFHIGRPTVA